MIYYFELFSENRPRKAEKQQIEALIPEEAVQRLKETYGNDLQVVYDENFDVQFDMRRNSAGTTRTCC